MGSAADAPSRKAPSPSLRENCFSILDERRSPGRDKRSRNTDTQRIYFDRSKQSHLPRVFDLRLLGTHGHKAQPCSDCTAWGSSIERCQDIPRLPIAQRVTIRYRAVSHVQLCMRPCSHGIQYKSRGRQTSPISFAVSTIHRGSPQVRIDAFLDPIWQSRPLGHSRQEISCTTCSGRMVRPSPGRRVTR